MEKPERVFVTEAKEVRRWFYNRRDLEDRVRLYVRMFAKFEGLPTLENLQRSLFWKSHACLMDSRQQDLFFDLWDRYASARPVEAEAAIAPEQPQKKPEGQLSLFE